MPPAGGIAMQTWDPMARTLDAPAPKGGHALRGLEDMAVDTEMQMTAILRPFAEHVRQLQATVQELADGLKRMDGRVDMQDKRLADQTMWGQQLKSAVDPLKAHMQSLANGVTQLNREKTLLEQDHEETKAAIRDITERLDGTRGVEESLLGSLAEQSQSIEQLRKEFQELRNHVSDSVEPSLGQHGQELAELHSRCFHLDHVLTQRGQMLDAHIQSFADFKQDCAKQSAEDQRSLHNMMQQLKRLHGLLDDSDGRISAQAEDLKGTTMETQMLRSLIDKLDGQATHLKDRADKVSREMVSWEKRIPPLEKGLHQLMEVANRPVKKDNRVKVVGDQLAETQQKMRNIGEFMHDLEDMVLKHKAQLEELVGKEEERHNQANSAVDQMRGQVRDLHGHIGKLSGDLKDLHDMHGASRGLIDTSMNLHSDHKSEFSNNDQKMSHLRSEVSCLQMQLQDATDGIAKLQASLELYNDYMSGMRKGFRDANTRVVGTEDPLLPEPNRQRPTTPVLPSMRGAKSATPSTAAGGASGRESSATCPSPGGVMNSARGEAALNRGVFANSATYSEGGRGYRVVSR